MRRYSIMGQVLCLGLVPKSLLPSLTIYIFISPNHGSSSVKYSKHNMQQNKQAKKEEKLDYKWHSAGSLGWPFPAVLKEKYIFFQRKIYGSNFSKQHSETVTV